MTNYSLHDLENSSIRIFKNPTSYSESQQIGYENEGEREVNVWQREHMTTMMNEKNRGMENDRLERNMSDEIINEVVKLKSELKNAFIENNELRKRYEEDTERLNTLAIKNATVLNEIADEKKLIQMEYTNYKAESMKDIKRLQDELDKNVIMLNCLKDEILYKEEELRKAEILEKLYREEISKNEEKDMQIKNLEILLNDTKNQNSNKGNEEQEHEQEQYKEEIETVKKELSLKNSELGNLQRKYETLKKNNKEIENKIHFLKEEVEYYKNNENSFIMHKIFNEQNTDEHVLKKNMMKLCVLYNLVYRMLVYDQRSLMEKEKAIYFLEKENVHFLKKFITDEIYAHYLKDCISKINLTYQIDLHKQEKKYMLLNSEYDELYNKFLLAKNDNCLLNEQYEKVIFHQKTEINQLKKVISVQNKDKEILTKYIDNYITYIENSYDKYCRLRNEYGNLKELVQELEEKNSNLTKLLNEIDLEKKDNVMKNISDNGFVGEGTLTAAHLEQIKQMRDELKDKDIQIIELGSRNLELRKQVEVLNEQMGKNNVEEFTESETLRIRELCFDLKDICSKLELEVKEKNCMIEELTNAVKQAEMKNDDNKVKQELSDFRIQNFNDNLKYYQNKIKELEERLKSKEEEIHVFQEYNEKLKEENTKCVSDIKNITNQLEDLQIENICMKREKMLIRNDILDNSKGVGIDNAEWKKTLLEEGKKNATEEHEQQLYQDVMKLKQTKKRIFQENQELEKKVEKLTKDNIFIIKENEELCEKMQIISKENIKIKNDLICTKADAEKSLFYLECEKKEKIKYKLRLQQLRKKNKRMKNSYFKMVKTLKYLVGNIKRIEKENKKNEMNNSLFVSSSSTSSRNIEVCDNVGTEGKKENGFISVNEIDNTQLVLSSISKSRNSGNNISTNGKTSMQSKSTKVNRDSQNRNLFSFMNKESNRNKKRRSKRNATRKVYMIIRMHRFTICNNFKINVRKYKKAYRELSSKFNYLNERRNDDLNIFTNRNKVGKSTTIETFYSIPNSADSIFISELWRGESKELRLEKERARGRKRRASDNLSQHGDTLALISRKEEIVELDKVNNEMDQRKKRKEDSFFESDKLINDINYIKKKYESKMRENITIQKRLIENEKELQFANMKYEDLIKEHDSLINEVKERTEKLSNIEKSYNLLFAKYNETQDEIKMHEQKTQDIFNECNELVEYMKTKEQKIKKVDDHLNKMEIKYKEEKEKNDILTKDNVALDNLNSKYKEDIELYKKRYESMHAELRMKMSKIEELEQNQKNMENENYYLKAATYKYELTLKESHDELNKTNELIVQMKREISENIKISEKMKEQIVKRDYLIYNIGRSYRSKEYFYKNLKMKVQGFNRTFIELCESFELSEVKKINDLYKEFEYTDEDYRNHISSMLLNQKGEYMESFGEILKKVNVVAEMNIQYEREKQEMVEAIKELENKLRSQMNEHNSIYEEYERNVKRILAEKEVQMNDCIILSEDLKKKNAEIHLLMKELEEKNVEINEINMKCTFLSGTLQNLESDRNRLNEKLTEMENAQEKKMLILERENGELKENIVSLKNIINTIDMEMRNARERLEFLSQEKDECEKEIEKLKDIIEEEKKFNELFKENEQNFIQEIKEAHVFALKKEEECNSFKLHYETIQQKYVEEINKLKMKNEEMNNVVRNHLKTVSDLETQMVEYKVLLDNNTSMKMQLQDLENKMHELIKDNEKLCVDLKKERILSEEKEKDVEELNRNLKMLEKKVYEDTNKTLKMKDEIKQLTEEIHTLQDIKKSKDELIEQLESNFRKAVFGDMQINEMEKERMKHKIFSEQELTGYGCDKMYTEMNNATVTFNDDLVNSQMCIFNNNNANDINTSKRGKNRLYGMDWGGNNTNMEELRKYNLVLKEENDLIKQELRKLQDNILVRDTKNKELEHVIERRDFIIKKMNEEIVEYNDKIKNLGKNMDKLNSELCASNELLALRNDECKELTNELYELSDVKNKLLAKNEVYQKQIELYKKEINQKEEQLNEKNRNYEDRDNNGIRSGGKLSSSQHNRLIEELNEKNSIINEYSSNLHLYYKIFSHIMYFKKYVEKEVVTTRSHIDENDLLHNSISFSFIGKDRVIQELEDIKVDDVNKISDYVNDFLKCVRLLIFRKRVFESKLENTEKKYNEFKKKLEEDKEIINNFKKQIRQYEENSWQFQKEESNTRRELFAKDNTVPLHVKENENDILRQETHQDSYKIHSDIIKRNNEKNSLQEEKNQLFLKFENERLAEENKYLNEQIHSLLVFKNNINEIKENTEREFLEELYQDNGNDAEYAMMVKNKCLKLQIETTINELNICKSKNEYLKKTVANYEEIIAAMQKELVKIIDTQRKCDEEFYKVETELEQKKKEMQILQRKRKEEAEIIEKEYTKNAKIEKDFITVKDDNFKKETKIKELEEVIKKLKEDIDEQFKEKEELREFANCMKIKYTTAEEKYNELLNIFEKEKEDFSENKKDEISNLVNKLKKYDEIITNLLNEKTTLLHKYEELKKVYAEKTKAESVLLQEMNLLEKSNKELKEKARELNDRIKTLMEENEQYNIKLFNLDKEKLDLYMKYLKVSEELNNLSSYDNAKKTKGQMEHKKKSVIEEDPLMNSLWVMENEIEEKERKLEQKLTVINKNEKEKELRESFILLEKQKEKDAFIEKAKQEIDDLTIENDLLKTKIEELEKLNKNIFNDNKELIKIISSIDKKIEKEASKEENMLHKKMSLHIKNQDLEKSVDALHKLSLHNSESKNAYQILLNEHILVKHQNEDLISEIEYMRNQLDEYKNRVSKYLKTEETNKRAKNYLYYLNDKIKTFIEIFNEKNFNFDYFKKELKKMKSTNLMILEDTFQNERTSISKRDGKEEEEEDDKKSVSRVEKSIVATDIEEESDRVSIDTRLIVNFFAAYDDEKYKTEFIVSKHELNRFYSYILKLKEHYKKKCLLIENQKGRIRSLNEEVVAYVENNKKQELQWKNKLNTLVSEQSLHTERFSKIHEALIKTLEEEIDRNKKLMLEIDQKNEQIKEKEEKELRLENLLQLKDADMYNEYTDGDVNYMLMVQNKYKEMKKRNVQISKINEKLLKENTTVKEAVINMKKEIEQLTQEINEKKMLLNKRNSEIEELRLKVLNGMGIIAEEKDGKDEKYEKDETDEKNGTKDNSQLIKNYEEVILLMEQRNNELEEQCEQLKKINHEIEYKYSRYSANANNEIVSSIKKKDFMDQERNIEDEIINEEQPTREINKELGFTNKQQKKEMEHRIIAKKEEEYMKLKKDYTDLLKEYEKYVQNFNNIKEEKEQIEHSMQKIREEKENSAKKMEEVISNLNGTIEELKTRLNEEVQSKKHILKEDSNMYDMLNKEIEFLKNQKNTSGNYIKELEFEIENLKNDINTMDNLLKDSKEEGYRVKQKLLKKESELSGMKHKLEETRRELEQMSLNMQSNNYNSNKIGNENMRNNQNIEWESVLKKERDRLEEYEKEIEELKRKSEIENEDYYKKLKELRMEIKRANENYNKLNHDMEKRVEAYIEEVKELKMRIKKMEEEKMEKLKKEDIIEIAIKEMDHEIETLKVEIEEKNTYIKELEKQIDESKEEIQFVKEESKAIESFIRNTVDNGNGVVKVEEINKKIDDIARKIEGLNKEKGRETKETYFTCLQCIFYVLRLNRMVQDNLKKKDEELKKEIRIKEKEMLQLDETINHMVQETKEQEQDIDNKRKTLNHLTNEIFKTKEELSRMKNVLNESQSKEYDLLIQKENNLQVQEQELKKTKEDVTQLGETLKKVKEEVDSEKKELEKEKKELDSEKKELEREKTQIEKQKKEIRQEFDKLYNAHKDIRVKENNLKNIYKKIKDQNLIELLDINNDEHEGGNENETLLDKELSILNSSLSFKKISENEINDDKINLDSIEYTTYFKEFKKRIKNLKVELSNKEKDLEIYKKTLEIEKKEKEIYRMELEKLEEILSTEKENVRKIETELAKYKDDDTNIVKRLKESEQILAEKNAEVIELQQKLLEFSYEMSLIDGKKKQVQNENVELVKEIERLNEIIKKFEKNINELNKEKIHITRKSIEKIIYDGEDIKQLKDKLEDANEEIMELKTKNEELDKINEELKETNAEMRYDIDVLLLNIEDINNEKTIHENNLKENEVKYNDLKLLYEEKEKEVKKLFQMLSEKKKKKVTHEWEKRQATLTSLNDTSTGLPYGGTQTDTHMNTIPNGFNKNKNIKEKEECDTDMKYNRSSALSFSENVDMNEEEKVYQQTLNEKNMIINSLNEKIAEYEYNNANHLQIIEDYKNVIRKFSNKINMFEDNLDFLIHLNEFMNENSYNCEQVLNILKDGFLCKKILKKILQEQQFFKYIIFIKGWIEEIPKYNNKFSKIESSDKFGFTKKENIPIIEFLNKTGEEEIEEKEKEKKKEEEEKAEEEAEAEEAEAEEALKLEEKYLFPHEMYGNSFNKIKEQLETVEREIYNEMVHMKQNFNDFEHLCEYLYNCYIQNDLNKIYETLNELGNSFQNIVDRCINQMGRVSKKVHFEKEKLKRGLKIVKKRMYILNEDYQKTVEETNQQNEILTKKHEQLELAITENNELRDLYEKLNDDYNEKLILLQNNEYELNELKEQLLEKKETKERTEEINEVLKTDLTYLNTSLDHATQNLTVLNSENKKHKMIIQELEEENNYMKNELHEKKMIIEELEINLESSNSMIRELKEVNSMLVKQIEEELQKDKKEDKSSYEEKNSVDEQNKKLKKEKEKEHYNKVAERELKEIIEDLKTDNRILSEELEIVQNNFTILQQKKKQLEEIINTNDIALNKKEIELNDFMIEKEKHLEEIKRYHVKCLQMVIICFNENLKIFEIRERIITLWEKEEEEENFVKYNNEAEEKISNIFKNYRGKEKREEMQYSESSASGKERMQHIEEMSKKNEELIKKNDEIWKLNKYIEELNKAVTDRDSTLIKNQQIIENQKDLLENNKNHIKFLKDQIKLLCNNIDADTMFDINNVHLTPELQNIIKRRSFLNDRNTADSKLSSSRKRSVKNGNIKEEMFNNSQKKNVSHSPVTNESELNFYDEKEVDIEELKLKIDMANDELRYTELELQKSKTANKKLIEECEYLKKELKNAQGTKRDLMLCESRIEILESELKEKTKKLEEQKKTVNECVDVYVEENSENFHKILELKKENEKYKMEIKIMNDEIRKLKNDIHNYKNEIKEVNATLKQYQSTHEQLISDFKEGETSNLYYIQLCDVLKKENQDYKEYVKMEEEKKQHILNDINDMKMQLQNAIRENNEITLDLEYFQSQNDMLKQSCNYYKEREEVFVNLLKDDKKGNLKLIENYSENYSENNVKVFVQNLKKEINELNQNMDIKTKTITSLKYQLKEYHMLQSSKNTSYSHANDVKELIDITDMAYVQNSLFIYINLFKSVLFIIKEILFYTDSKNALYFELLKILQLQEDEEEEELEVDSMIKKFQLAKIDKDVVFEALLKSKPVLREKLQMLQLKIR